MAAAPQLPPQPSSGGMDLSAVTVLVAWRHGFPNRAFHSSKVVVDKPFRSSRSCESKAISTSHWALNGLFQTQVQARPGRLLLLILSPPELLPNILLAICVSVCSRSQLCSYPVDSNLINVYKVSKLSGVNPAGALTPQPVCRPRPAVRHNDYITILWYYSKWLQINEW